MVIINMNNVFGESAFLGAAFFFVAPIADILKAAANPNKINFFMFPPLNFLIFYCQYNYILIFLKIKTILSQ